MPFQCSHSDGRVGPAAIVFPATWKIQCLNDRWLVYCQFSCVVKRQNISCTTELRGISRTRHVASLFRCWLCAVVDEVVAEALFRVLKTSNSESKRDTACDTTINCVCWTSRLLLCESATSCTFRVAADILPALWKTRLGWCCGCSRCGCSGGL